MRMKKQAPMERGAGILLPVSALPSSCGIGTLGRAAYDFIDFMNAAGQRYWQILPIGPTSYGDSPYQSFSAFAGNPYLIDLEVLCEQKLLTQAEIDACRWGDAPDSVDYAALYESRFTVLRAAFDRFDTGCGDFAAFCGENESWLDEYSLFMAIKTQQGGRSWQEWPAALRMREAKALAASGKALRTECAFWRFCQFQFYRQWNALKAYAGEKRVQIIGDIPIYVALDSADVWQHHALFQLDGDRRPTRVAGVPPDLFSATGQLWGNPLYDWNRMERDGFAWWRRRMAFCARLYDIVRIDHFVGIAHYYSIPAADATAENGEWVRGPQRALLAAISREMGNSRIVAEDLGIVTPAVRAMQRSGGYPGMKLLCFGFDSDARNENLPSYYSQNTVVYGGTHDNETLAGYFSHCKRSELRFAREYLHVRGNRGIPAAIIRAAYASVANAAIFQMQDYLGLDNSARMNTPATTGGNWRWRVTARQLSPGLAAELAELSRIYGRRQDI